jgi:hypothetical protein
VVLSKFVTHLYFFSGKKEKRKMEAFFPFLGVEESDEIGENQDCAVEGNGGKYSAFLSEPVLSASRTVGTRISKVISVKYVKLMDIFGLHLIFDVGCLSFVWSSDSMNVCASETIAVKSDLPVCYLQAVDGRPPLDALHLGRNNICTLDLAVPRTDCPVWLRFSDHMRISRFMHDPPVIESKRWRIFSNLKDLILPQFLRNMSNRDLMSRRFVRNFYFQPAPDFVLNLLSRFHGALDPIVEPIFDMIYPDGLPLIVHEEFVKIQPMRCQMDENCFVCEALDVSLFQETIYLFAGFTHPLAWIRTMKESMCEIFQSRFPKRYKVLLET